jgi:hypothetical protein
MDRFMKLLALPASMFALFVAGTLWGQDAPANSSDESSASQYVSIDASTRGENRLLVRYPWTVHEKASIEIRLISDAKDFSARAKPLRFAAHFDADAQKAVYRMEDEALTRPGKEKIRLGDMDWTIVAERNHLGNAAVWAINRQAVEHGSAGTTAALYNLAPWRIDDRTLSIDFPPEYFDKPGKMRVWFLRGDKIIWDDELSWPGRK